MFQGIAEGAQIADSRACDKATHVEWATSEARTLRFEDLSLDLDSCEVYRGQRLVELTRRECDLLTYLLRHPRQVVERDQLLEEVWDYDFIGNINVLHVYIRSLRNKLEVSGEARLIQTVRGIGYVLELLE